MKTARIPILFFLILLLLSACSSSENEKAEEPSSTRILEFPAEVSFLKSDQSPVATIKSAIADDDESRNEGLMNVFDLPDDSGMLFIFEDEQPRSFWMANTPLSLDILFVDSELEIVRIRQNTSPYSNQSIESELPARYVIEVNAGYTLRHDITEGMAVDINLTP